MGGRRIRSERGLRSAPMAGTTTMPTTTTPRTTLLDRLAGISPFGPIFGKELRTTARRKRSYVLRVAYLGALLLTLLVAWSATSNRVYGTSVAAQAQAQAQLGQMFFAFFCVF